MSLARGAGAAAIVLVLAALMLRSNGRPATGAASAQITAGAAAALSPPPGAIAAVHAPEPPALPAEPPFRAEDFAVTTDMPDGPLVVLRSSSRTGSHLDLELATREPLAAGKRVFATVSVSDALGNTVMDCTWRDIALGDDMRKLECELPAGSELPLTISGHQRSAPSFVENPQVVAIDRRAQ